MFEKLLSLVPYNPGLTHQLAFYSRRMREEASIRRTGMIFLALTFFVQFFAVLSPPQPTVASSPNDLITGGVRSAADAKTNCLNDTRGYMHILHYYGISCAAFDTATTTCITRDAEGDQYFSLGQNPTGSAGETPVTIDGAGTVYWRHLTTFTNPAIPPCGTNQWHVLAIHSNGGKLFYVMFACGNLVSVHIPSPAPLPTTETIKEVTTLPSSPSVPSAPGTSSTPAAPAQPEQRCQYNSAIPASSTACVPPCQYNGSLLSTSPLCKPCDKSISSQDKLACVEVHKTAANVTENIADANNTTARAGDVITYTLYAENKGKAKVASYQFQENLSDVLDYADVTDLHGGTIDTNGDASWPKLDILAGHTSTVQVTVTVKNPIPQTPTSTSDPAHFDLIMTNVYGNTINIKLPGSPAKVIETATTTGLPNTGPGASLFLVGGVVIIAGYFYGRARLLARESDLAIKEAAVV